MARTPLNFGRNTSTGRYDKTGSDPLLEALKVVNYSVKSGNEKVISLLTDIYKKPCCDENGSDNGPDLNSKLENTINEVKNFSVGGLVKAAVAASAGNFKGFEGIFTAVNKGIKVEVTNWDKSGFGAKKEEADIPIYGLLKNILTFNPLGSKAEQVAKVDVIGFENLVHAVEALAHGLLDKFVDLREKPVGLFGRTETKEATPFAKMQIALESISANTTSTRVDLGNSQRDIILQELNNISNLTNVGNFQSDVIGHQLDELMNAIIDIISSVDALDDLARLMLSRLIDIDTNLKPVIHVIVDNWPDRGPFAVLPKGIDIPPVGDTGEITPNFTPRKPTQLVPDFTTSKASLADWNEMNPSQRKQYTSNKENKAEEEVKGYADIFAKWNALLEQEKALLELHTRLLSKQLDLIVDKADLGEGVEGKHKSKESPLPDELKGEKRTQPEYKRPPKKGGREGFLDVAAIAGGFATLASGLGGMGTALVTGTIALGGFITAALAASPLIIGLGIALAPLVIIVGVLAAALAAVVGALLVFTVVANVGISVMQALFAGFTKTVSDIGSGLNDAFGKIAHGDFYGALQASATTLVKSFEDVGTTVTGLIPLVGDLFTNLIKNFTGLAQTTIQLATGFAQNMLPLVQQISPSTVENFNLQMRNLQATLGIAFTGFVANMADAIKQIAGVFLPLAEEMKPTFTELGGLLRDLIVPMFRILASLLGTIFTPLAGAMGTLRTAVVEVVKSMLVGAALIARLFGANDFIDRLRDSLGRQGQAGATAVGPGNISSFEELGKQLALAAGNASVGAGAESTVSQTDLLAGILESIDEIRTDGIDEILDKIQEALKEFWDRLVVQWNEKSQMVLDWLENSLQPVFNAVMDRLWNLILSWLQHAFPSIPHQVQAYQGAVAELGTDFIRDYVSGGLLSATWNFYTR